MIGLRPTTSAERRTIVRQWLRATKPKAHEISTELGPDSWIRQGSLTDRYLSPRWWHAMYRNAVETAVCSPDSTVVVAVACFASAPDIAVGWIAYEPSEGTGAVVHFVHVNEPDRRHGVGSLLLSSVADRWWPLRLSHLTPAGRALVNAVALRRRSREDPEHGQEIRND